MGVKSQMKNISTLLFAALAFALVLPTLSLTAETVRIRESLNSDWRFTKDDPADAGTNLNYAATKPWLLPLQNGFTTNAPVIALMENFGGDVSYAQPGFNDSGWRKLNLPHDFALSKTAGSKSQDQ
jgi:beta-galactosidase